MRRPVNTNRPVAFKPADLLRSDAIYVLAGILLALILLAALYQADVLHAE